MSSGHEAPSPACVLRENRHHVRVRAVDGQDRWTSREVFVELATGHPSFARRWCEQEEKVGFGHPTRALGPATPDRRPRRPPRSRGRPPPSGTEPREARGTRVRSVVVPSGVQGETAEAAEEPDLRVRSDPGSNTPRVEDLEARVLSSPIVPLSRSGRQAAISKPDGIAWTSRPSAELSISASCGVTPITTDALVRARNHRRRRCWPAIRSTRPLQARSLPIESRRSATHGVLKRRCRFRPIAMLR